MGNHLLTDQVLPDMNAAWIGSRDNSSRTILSLSASPQETQAAISVDPDLPECLCTTADLLAADSRCAPSPRGSPPARK